MNGNTYTARCKEYYETKVKTNPDKLAERAAYHADWQRKNKYRLSEYRRKRREAAKLEATNGNT